MKKLLPMLPILLLASPAAALQIENCDKETRSVTVDYYGTEEQITLQPGQSRWFFGRARELKLGDQTVTLIHPHDQYCVRDGKIKIQKRKRNSRNVR